MGPALSEYHSYTVGMALMDMALVDEHVSIPCLVRNHVHHCLIGFLQRPLLDPWLDPFLRRQVKHIFDLEKCQHATIYMTERHVYLCRGTNRRAAHLDPFCNQGKHVERWNNILGGADLDELAVGAKECKISG